jgi:cell fate regulator YaaT (PSP1 superfamily)
LNIHPTTSNDSLFFNNNNQRRHSLAGPLLTVNQQEMMLSELSVRERLPLLPTPSASKSEIPTNNKMDDMGKGTRLDSDILLEAIFYVVEFKGGRSDVFFSHQQQQIQLNDLVLVEADRGRDLGKVTQENVSRQQLQSYYTQLKQSNANTNNNIMQQEEVIIKKKYLPSEMYIKSIFRKARQDEITLLMAKGQDESKALMVCQSKIKQKKLNMQVVDAEYQWLVYM